MLAFKSQVLVLLGADSETLKHASDYYFWIVLGSPAAVVNIILDPILITLLGLGAAGAAIASVIGYLFTDIFLILIVASKSRSLSMDPRKIHIPMGCAGQIFGIGIPAAIVNIMQSISVILVNQFLLPYGNDRIAAMGIVLKVSMIVLLILTGLAFGGQPMFGYYFGSGNRKKLRELLRFCMSFISITAIILTIAVRIGGYTGIIAAQAVSDVVSAILALILLRTQLYSEFWTEY